MHRPPQNHQQAMACLIKAQAGCYDSRTEVTLYVFERWKYRAHALFAQDRSLDHDDLEQVFFLGILEGVEKVDERGNPLFHLSQRGLWRVKSTVKASQLRGMTVTQDLGDVRESRLRENTDDHADLVINRVSADQMLIGVAPHLSDRARDAFMMMINGDLGDPAEPGLNKRLAEAMKVSEQRASQIMAKVRRGFDELEAEPEAD